MEMGGAHLHQPQCILYLPLSWVEAREELLILSVVCFPYLLGESGRDTHLHFPCLCLSGVYEEEGLICTTHTSTLSGGGGGANMHPSQSVSL